MKLFIRCLLNYHREKLENLMKNVLLLLVNLVTKITKMWFLVKQVELDGWVKKDVFLVSQ